MAGVSCAFLFLLGLDLWLWATYWSCISKAYQGAPIEDYLLVSVSGQGCSCLAAISASPETVMEACRDWARDLRWYEAPGPEGFVFGLYGRFHPNYWLGLNPRMAVQANPKDGQAEASFVLTSAWEYFVADRKRMCETFARGVCSDLALRGCVVSPPELAVPYQDRGHLRRVVPWRSRIQLTLAMFGLVVLAAYVLSSVTMGGDGYLPALAGAFFVLSLMFAGDLTLLRSVGAHNVAGLLVVPPTIAAALALTVVAFYYS